MEWSDEGVVLSARAHGENHAVVELFTERHGRAAGLVYGGQGRNKAPMLQTGNGVAATWSAKSEGQLGRFALEPMAPRAALALANAEALRHLTAACGVVAATLAEREPHPALYDAFLVLLDAVDDGTVFAPLLAKFELMLLQDLGFGLALDRCVATGAKGPNLVLTHVSPKSGGAVSAEAAEPYKDKLLPLPAFLWRPGEEPTADEVRDALRLSRHFIESRILHPADRQAPEARMKVEEGVAALAADEALEPD
ncbi:MAG: DNA repair protein RecO [Pseudomonadota bacterium]